MQDRRKEKRKPMDGRGFFLKDGQVLEFKIRDSNSSGIGAFSCRELKPGEQGILMERIPASTEEPEGVPSEVCWCLRDYMTEDSFYPYRVGLRIL